MDKRAQKRGLLNELREAVNIPGSYLEGFFRPELDRVMSSLKDLDDRIRAELTGTKIGNAEAPEIERSAKDLVKSARTNFNRREYIIGISDLGLFHKKMYDIVRDIDKFYVDVNKIHNKFLFEGLDDSQQETFKKFREHMERKAEISTSEYFIKEAGIMDFFYNIGTKRGRSLMAWEKKYPKQTKELREGGNKLISAAENLLNNTLSYLKQMATARAVRRPDDYMDIAAKIKQDFNKFDSGDKGFRSYYANVIVPFLKTKDEIEAKEKLENKPIDQSGKIELGAPVPPTSPNPNSPAPPAPPTAPSGPMGGPPGASEPFTPEPEEKTPDTQKEQAPAGSTVSNPSEIKYRVAYLNFISSLESLSEEDPRIIKKYISKYASSIQKTDPETAVLLFDLAHKIEG